MLIEFPVAELLGKTPEEGVRHVLSVCLKQSPSASFLARHAEAIKADDLGFLEGFLGQWPGVFRSTAGKQQRGVDAMKLMADIISTRFLMAVPREQFIDVAYQEFFGRDLTTAERTQYTGQDFDLPEQREAVIASLAGCAEFSRLSRSKVLAGPADLVRQLGKSGTTALYWDERVAMPAEWYAEGSMPQALSGQYMPFLLWLADRRHLYSLPGVHLRGELEENSLKAPPEWVLWGPKASLAAGDYRISINLEGESSDLFLFDAASEGATKIHAKIEYFGSINLQIALRLERSVRDFEMRLFNYTGRNAGIKIIELSLVRRY